MRPLRALSMSGRLKSEAYVEREQVEFEAAAHEVCEIAKPSWLEGLASLEILLAQRHACLTGKMTSTRLCATSHTHSGVV